jgi:hypothetical protein
MNYEERIKEYSEEVDLISRGLSAYESYPERIDMNAIETFKHDREAYELRLKKKTLEARISQLTQMMQKAEKQLEMAMQEMKEEWKKVLKDAMDIADKMSKKHKALVRGYKDRDMKKAFPNDREKLQAYMTMKNLINQYSNGKSI